MTTYPEHLHSAVSELLPEKAPSELETDLQTAMDDYYAAGLDEHENWRCSACNEYQNLNVAAQCPSCRAEIEPPKPTPPMLPITPVQLLSRCCAMPVSDDGWCTRCQEHDEPRFCQAHAMTRYAAYSEYQAPGIAAELRLYEECCDDCIEGIHETHESYLI